jgi:hypothetical protein
VGEEAPPASTRPPVESWYCDGGGAEENPTVEEEGRGWARTTRVGANASEKFSGAVTPREPRAQARVAGDFFRMDSAELS